MKCNETIVYLFITYVQRKIGKEETTSTTTVITHHMRPHAGTRAFLNVCVCDSVRENVRVYVSVCRPMSTRAEQ